MVRQTRSSTDATTAALYIYAAFFILTRPSVPYFFFVRFGCCVFVLQILESVKLSAILLHLLSITYASRNVHFLG